MKIPQPELWVIDWVLSGQGETVSGEKLESLMTWKDLRQRVWRAQLAAELATKIPTNPAQAEIDLTHTELEQLLAIIPTTFRWGTGEDCGFALKRRIAEELWAAEELEKYEMNKSLANIFGGPDASSTS